ncbi:MAG: hypothetical protein ACKOA9_12735 [Actinomycetota bacterium]
MLEAHGLATIALISVRGVAERLPPPRGLYCEFPLGRPLGRPDDPEFQRAVLRRAFALLERHDGPVLEDYPVVITSDTSALACPMPPRFDANVPEAVDEARGLRAAYDRTLARRGVTSIGRVLDADQVPDALGVLAAIAEGADWKDAGFVGDPVQTCHDIRTYYEEAAAALVDTVPAGQGESWFYEQTAAGHTMLAARARMREQGAPVMIWLYMARATR